MEVRMGGRIAAIPGDRGPIRVRRISCLKGRLRLSCKVDARFTRDGNLGYAISAQRPSPPASIRTPAVNTITRVRTICRPPFEK